MSSKSSICRGLSRRANRSRTRSASHHTNCSWEARVFHPGSSAPAAGSGDHVGNAVKALPSIIKSLEARGLEVGTVSELLSQR